MSINMFFIPSTEITAQIIRRIGERRAKRLRQAAADYLPSETADTAESSELLSAVADALENKGETAVRDDWYDRRWLSEIVYHFMGRLAGRSQRGGQNTFKLTPCIVQGMRPRLGLHEPEDVALLTELASEFSRWLSQLKDRTFPAGWGKIVGSVHDPESLSFRPLQIGVAQRAGTYSFSDREATNPFADTTTGRPQPARVLEAEMDG
jgi:hypothetical protein